MCHEQRSVAACREQRYVGQAQGAVRTSLYVPQALPDLIGGPRGQTRLPLQPVGAGQIVVGERPPGLFVPRAVETSCGLALRVRPRERPGIRDRHVAPGRAPALVALGVPHVRERQIDGGSAEIDRQGGVALDDVLAPVPRDVRRNHHAVPSNAPTGVGPGVRCDAGGQPVVQGDAARIAQRDRPAFYAKPAMVEPSAVAEHLSADYGKPAVVEPSRVVGRLSTDPYRFRPSRQQNSTILHDRTEGGCRTQRNIFRPDYPTDRLGCSRRVMRIAAVQRRTSRVQTHRQIQVVVGREQRYVAQEQGPVSAPLYAPDELLHLRVDPARGPDRRRAPREVRPRQDRIDRPDDRPAPRPRRRGTTAAPAPAAGREQQRHQAGDPALPASSFHHVPSVEPVARAGSRWMCAARIRDNPPGRPQV